MEKLKRMFTGFGRTQSQKYMDTTVMDAFHKLFPYLKPHDMYDPARSALMAGISNMGTNAFSAYEDPEVEGLQELTTQENVIRHLQWDGVHDAIEAVLKIELHGAKNLRDSDGLFQGHSDPYVVFSAGGSCVRSEVVYDSADPVWNSIHYLLLRKRSLEPNSDSELNIAVYDKDTRTGIASVMNGIDKDDHLGSAQFDLAKLARCCGVHNMEVKLNGTGNAKKGHGSVFFSAKRLSVEEALAEMGLDQDSSKWMERLDTDEDETSWKDITNMTEVGFIPTNPVAFIDATTTGTQAWVHVNKEAKVVIVAFRGTEINRLKDILTDLRFTPVPFTASMISANYALKPTTEMLDDDIKVHRGFRDAYDSIRESVLRIVYDITGWDQDWTVCITGHSLGGALATFCAFEFANRKLPVDQTFLRSFMNILRINRDDTKICVGPKIGMMNFGAPRVGNEDFVENYNSTVDKSLRVVNTTDLVHFLPPILYSHTNYEVLLQINGEVKIAGKNFQSGDLADDVQNVEDEYKDGGKVIRERAFCGMSVTTHMQPYYYEIVKAAVDKFFKKDVKMRGRPMRITKTSQINKVSCEKLEVDTETDPATDAC